MKPIQTTSNFNIISDDNQIIPFRRNLMPIGKTIAGTVLLGQIMYWSQKAYKKGKIQFYKFQGPCEHEKYKEGDSWIEELGCSKRNFVTALKQIGRKYTKKQIKKIQELQHKKNPTKHDKEEIKQYKNTIVYYRTDTNKLTWYRLNQSVLDQKLMQIYGATPDNEPAFGETTNPHLDYIQEITTETSVHPFSKEKANDFVSASPPPTQRVGGIVREAKKPCYIKKKFRKKSIIKKKPPQSKYPITNKSLPYYTALKNAGATKHKETTKAYFDTMDKIHALFSNKCQQPYNSCNHVPEQFIDYEWTFEELIEVFTFHLKNAESFGKKKIKSIGQFIVSKGFNGGKAWSPLLYWHQRLNKTNNPDLDELGEKLNKSFKRTKINTKDLENPTLNRIGQQIELLEKYYEFVDDGDEMSYPFGIVDYFTKIYVKEKLNDTRFKIYHINKKTFVRDFVRTALQRNFLKKQHRWIGVNLTNVELGQKPGL